MDENMNATVEGQETGSGEETAAVNQEGQENQETKTYTQEDFDKALQSETDKRVQQALKTAQDKWQKEYEAKVEAEKDEAARLAKMTTEERAKAEAEKEREKFERERKQYQREKLEFETGKQLADRKLSPKFASFLAQNDAETTKANLDAFEQVVRYMKECGVGYGSINHPIDTCRKCGHRGVIYSKCPVCGSDDILRMRRITGYLTGSLESWNSAKQAEERDRVKHR